MRTIWYFALLPICLFMPVAAQTPLARHPPSQSPQHTEELLGEIDDDALNPGRWQASLDGRRLAWRTRRDKKWVMIVDGQPSSSFDEVSIPKFSLDGQRLAYAAKSEKKWRMVVDGQAGPEFDELAEGLYQGPRSPLVTPRPYAMTPLVWFSPNSKHAAYLARRGKNWFIVINGRESVPYEDITAPFFSSDGEHIAFPAKQAGMWRMIVDGKDQALTFDRIFRGVASFGEHRFPRFSQSGQRLGYLGRRKKDWFAVLEGKEIPVGRGPGFAWYDPPQCVSFSDDLRRVAYVQKHPEGKGLAVFVDGQPGASSDWPSCPVFSPDGKQFAYVAERGKVQFVVVDGQAGPPFKSILTFDGIPAISFSPDSRRIAYLAWQQTDKEEKGKVIEVISGAMREVAEKEKMQMLVHPPTSLRTASTSLMC